MVYGKNLVPDYKTLALAIVNRTAVSIRQQLVSKQSSVLQFIRCPKAVYKEIIYTDPKLNPRKPEKCVCRGIALFLVNK